MIGLTYLASVLLMAWVLRAERRKGAGMQKMWESAREELAVTRADVRRARMEGVQYGIRLHYRHAETAIEAVERLSCSSAGHLRRADVLAALRSTGTALPYIGLDTVVDWNDEAAIAEPDDPFDLSGEMQGEQGDEPGERDGGA